MKHELSKEQLAILKIKIKVLTDLESEGALTGFQGIHQAIDLLACRALLAAHEQEPYGYVHKAIYETVGSCGLSSDHAAYRNTNGSHIPLYAHPEPSIPAAVPWQEPIGAFHISGGTVEATTDYCKDGEWPVQDGIVEVYARPAPTNVASDKWPQKINWSHHDDMTQGEVLAWNNAIEACRAAMLQSEPDGWVPVSERLPEVGSTIMVHMDKPQHSATNYAISTYDKYGFSRAKVTHWQPLPAEPKV